MTKRQGPPPADSGAAVLFTELLKFERISQGVYVMEGRSGEYIAKGWMTEEYVIALRAAIDKALPDNVVRLRAKEHS